MLELKPPNPKMERAYRDLKHAIVRCEFEPGQRLRVDDLSKRLEISSSPVREALSRLAEQGLVLALDKRGFRVAPLTIAGIADLTRVRLLIECEALKESMSQGDDAWEAKLVAAAHSLSLVEQRLGEHPVSLDNNWSDRHRSFHMATYAACKSPLLIELVAGLFDSSERYRRYSASHRKGDRGKHDEHNRILKSVLARDVDAAVSLLSQHILGTEKMVTQALMLISSKKERT
jgi:DNA-binding GntR family transcriptional regulator